VVQSARGLGLDLKRVTIVAVAVRMDEPSALRSARRWARGRRAADVDRL
jgi:hypothetical protein